LCVAILDDHAFVVGDQGNVPLHQIVHRPLNEGVVHADWRATGSSLVYLVEENDQAQIVCYGILNL